MDIKQKIKEKYQLSDYQMAQLAFLLKNFFSELSKMLIMGILFYDHLKTYFFLLLMMFLLRSFSGGLHFYTYGGCLIASITYMGTIIFVLSKITLPRYMQLFLLLICIMTCYFTGPVLSRYRTQFSSQNLYYCRNITCLLIFIYALVMYIIPENPYFTAGFWMIILHSLQLFVAKIQKKGGSAK